jgi:hypothetical protein
VVVVDTNVGLPATLWRADDFHPKLCYSAIHLHTVLRSHVCLLKPVYRCAGAAHIWGSHAHGTLGTDGRHAPYGLAADLGEVKNLMTALPSVVGDLQQRLNSWIAKGAVSGVQEFDNITYDCEVAEQLKR